MNRRKFLEIAGTITVVAAAGGYLLSDKNNFIRADIEDDNKPAVSFQPHEREILYLASLAPSGHNTQPWLVKYVEPYHWIIGNDKSKWLPAVDPSQRETILSIGAFLQNLELAALHYGYTYQYDLLARTNQDENMIQIKLARGYAAKHDIDKIKNRRTVRSGLLTDLLKKEDATYLINDDRDCFHFIERGSKAYSWLNEQTIAANRLQAYRDAAQKEHAEWIRFSSKDAQQHLDGLTIAGMEFEGISAWILRNFYSSKDVLRNKFREQGIDKVRQQVSQSAGWMIITSKDNSVQSLLETGKRFQRMFLKVRDRNIAIHPMTQVLEEPQARAQVGGSIGIGDNIQFILRTGYVNDYPMPVSLRRPVDWFVKK
jgi:hypothetical protein